MIRQSKIRKYTGLAALAMVLAVFAGCATDVKVGPAPVTQEPSVANGPFVARLEDGRDGFIIREDSHMEEALRKDFERAVAMLKEQAYGPAIDLLENLIEQSPGVTAPYINLAIAYARTGKPEQAEQQLKSALRLVPAHPVACNEYGLLYRKMGKFAEAREMYETAIARFPNYYPVHRNLGILCDLYLNDLACALAHYEIYSEAMPEDQQVKLWIADLRIRFGNN